MPKKSGVSVRLDSLDAEATRLFLMTHQTMLEDFLGVQYGFSREDRHQHFERISLALQAAVPSYDHWRSHQVASRQEREERPRAAP